MVAVAVVAVAVVAAAVAAAAVVAAAVSHWYSGMMAVAATAFNCYTCYPCPSNDGKNTLRSFVHKYPGQFQFCTVELILF